MAEAVIKGLKIDVKPPKDADASRDRFTRWVVLLGLGLLAALVPMWFGILWGSFISLPRIGLLAGIAGAAALLTPLLIRSIVSNPEWTGYVTLDSFTGRNIPYGPGLHPAYFWEQRNKDGNYSLKVVTKTFELPVQTKTSRVIANGIFEYQVDLANITNNIGIDESTVDDGYKGFIESFLTTTLAGKTAEEAREGIDIFNQQLQEQFMESTTSQGSTVPEFEDKNGIRTVAIAISGLALPPAVQKTRDAVDEGRKIFQIMAELRGVTVEELRAMIADGRISKEDETRLRHAAMAVSENAEMKIFEGPAAPVGAFGAGLATATEKH